MSKKMHRCPHCGGKGYSFRATMSRRYEVSIEGLDYDKSVNLPDSFLKCQLCGKQSNVYLNGDNNKFHNIITALLLIAIIVVVILAVFLDWKIPFIVILLIAFVGIGIDFSCFSCYFRCLLPIDNDSNRKTLLKVHPNCQVKLGDTKYIRNMWVYGLKFETETKNIKFKERFEDGLVPAQFYPNEKGGNAFDIRIIGREFVPDEVLFEGAEFFVEDIDGIFVCKGKVTKVDLDY